MPVCNDSARAQLVHEVARRSSIEAVQALLEKAVEYRDSQRINAATSMLHNILTKTATSTDAFSTTVKGETLRYTSCTAKDCEGCFWNIWCETKEHYDILSTADAVIKKAKRNLREG